MDDKAAAPRDWLEPPEWWKKWRPLRWLAGLVVLWGLYSWLGPDGGDDGARRVAADTPRPQATPAEVVLAATPEPVAEATAAPAASKPTVAARMTPAPVAKAAPEPTAAKDVATYEALPSAASSSASADDDAFTRVEPDPVPILGIYRSYMSVDTIVYSLEQAGFTPQVESNHARVPGDVPPRNLDIVTVHQYQHWNVQGELELQFFNDRLFQAEFEPDEAEPYRAAQQRELPQLKTTTGRSELVEGNLRIASSLDLAVSEVGRKLRTRPFLLWQDRRLVKQRDEWDRRFSERATR